VLELSNRGNFDMLPIAENRFLLEDLQTEVLLLFGGDGKVVRVATEAVFNAEGYALLEAGDLEDALSVFRTNCANFPNSPNTHDSLGEALELAGRPIAALTSFRRAVVAGEAAGDANLSLYQANVSRIKALLADGSEEPAPQSPITTPPDKDDSDLEHVVRSVYSEISFEAGGTINFERLQELFLTGAIFSQPVAEGKDRSIRDEKAFFDDLKRFVENSPMGKSGFHEVILGMQMREFGDTAQARVAFQSYIGTPEDGRGNRGIDSIALVRVKGNWRVISIATEYETPELPLPKWVTNEGSR
jgi:tetratricopeptide (TPR) repeat protein